MATASSVAASDAMARIPSATDEVVTVPPAADVAFASADTGWLALTLAPSSGDGPARTEVLGTFDGGSQWTEQWEGQGQPEQLVSAGAGHALL
jgi:hypothetical protein